MDYKNTYYSGSYSDAGLIGLRIDVSAAIDIQSEEMRTALRDAADIVVNQIKRQHYANDPKAIERARQQEAGITGLFADPVYVKKIPNGYCNQACCEHLPWFDVTTRIGHVVIGWRKRVTSIDWSDTSAPGSEVLFAAENTTKGRKSIHAWSYDDARRYVNAILAPAEVVSS